MSVFSRLLNHIPNTKTVITWYRRSEGLADDAKIYVFGDGHALRVLRNIATRVIRGLSKDERLVLLDADKVDERLRTYAEQELESTDLVYVADVAPSPEDADLITVCALLASAYNEEPAPMAEKVEETPIIVTPKPVAPKAEPKPVQPKPASKPRAKAKPRAKVMPKAEPKREEPAPVAPKEESKPVQPKKAPKPRAKVMPKAEPKREEPKPVTVAEPEPMPVVRPVSRSAKKKATLDSIFIYLAQHCRRTTYYKRRSRWSGQVESYSDSGDIYRAFQIGVFVVIALWGACSYSYVYRFRSIDMPVVIYSLIALLSVWSAFMWWVSKRVDKAREAISANVAKLHYIH